MTRLNFLLLCTAGLLVSVLPGCGGGATTEVPDLVPVSGTVMLGDKPGAGVYVVFNPITNPEDPTDKTAGTGASDITDENGKYTLEHRSGQPGIQPGMYSVTFSKIGMPDGSPIPELKDDQTPGSVGAVQLIPQRYTVIVQTPNGLNQVIVKKEGGTFDFKLKSK